MLARFIPVVSLVALSCASAWAAAPQEYSADESCKPSRSGGCTMPAELKAMDPSSQAMKMDALSQNASGEVKFSENVADVQWIKDMENMPKESKNAVCERNEPAPHLNPANAEITAEGDFNK
ncbi:MAG: hypothetical protein ACK5O7_07150 [Holosporales bacterium]